MFLSRNVQAEPRLPASGHVCVCVAAGKSVLCIEGDSFRPNPIEEAGRPEIQLTLRGVVVCACVYPPVRAAGRLASSARVCRRLAGCLSA